MSMSNEPKKSNKPEIGSGQLARQAQRACLSTEQVIDVVKAVFPESKIDRRTVATYRSRMH